MDRAVYRCLAVAVWLSLTGRAVLPAAEPPVRRAFEEDIRPILKQHCYRCHGQQQAKAGLRIDRLGPDMVAARTAETWHEMLNRVNSGEMPPQGEPPIAPAELNRLNQWAAGELRRAAAQESNRIVVRRLNRAEYANTIRDLIGIRYDAGQNLPEDAVAHGFDNIGSALSISPLQMEKYLRTARKVIDLAIVSGEQPKREVWRFQAERRSPQDRGYYYENDAKFGNTGTTPHKQRGRFIAWTLGGGTEEFETEGFEHLKPVDKTEFRTQVLRAINFTFPQAGEYAIRVRAFGHYPKGPIPEHHLYGPPRLNVTSDGAQVLACDVTAAEDAPQVVETRFFSEAVRTTVFVRNRYEYSANFILQDLGERISPRSPEFPLPYLAVDWYEVDGPIYDTWPPESHARILFDSPNRDREQVYAREVLERFASRAFRRPVRPAELDLLLAAFTRARPSKPSFEEAIKVPLIAVLCSPGFLLLTEETGGEEKQPRQLDDYELAARLSYFLWSSMPDEELSSLAASNRLRDEGVLDAQVTRMLADPKSQALVDNFAGQWLGLRKLGEVVPDERLFPRYGEHLEESMAGETRSFFAEILHHDLSVRAFIQSDFAMLNERLARFYGIEGVHGDHFRKVALTPNDHRGGLLTQASMLTITSNGTRTSPVKRGAWILENILADPPPPPPPNAGEIPPPAVTGRHVSVRQRLALHRSVAACAACHQKIDPLGFALENYDASGLYRTKESSRTQLNPHPRDPAIDATGELPDGRKFNGVDELKQLLLQEEDRFLDCLTRKLLIYSLGRGLNYADQPTVTQLRETMKKNGFHLRALISAIVHTPAFQTK